MLSARRGVPRRRLAPAGAGGAPLAERLAELCDGVAASGRRVAMVTFDHIASCPGAIMPVAQMARVCKQRNVPTVLADAAHALGQVRLDLRALEAAGVTHFMADAHKWLYSPKGSAMLWVTREAQASMYPSAVGAVCSNSRTTNFDPAALANLSEFERRFQYTGTRDYTPLVAVADALRWREKVGESAILGYNTASRCGGRSFWHPSGTPRRSSCRRSARRSWRTRACQSRHPARRRS